jgi:hypothetical protein
MTITNKNRDITFIKNVLRLKERSTQDPLRFFRATPPQRAFINDPSPVKMLLGGNQVGKTYATCALLLYHCLNRHPKIKTDPPPIEAWLVTHSHEQSRTIQGKLWDMVPKDELHPDVEFVPGKGFRGLAPVVRFKNGSIIRIKTANQGLGLASATANLICIDEPVDALVFNELLARTLRGGTGGKSGTLAISMTPVGNVDVQYLRDMIEADRISVHRAALTVKDTTPVGCKPLLSQEQIDTITENFLPIDREARITGSLDVTPQGVIFDCFDPVTMISRQPVPAGGDYRFCVGIDHGSQPNTQIAILCCIDMQDPQAPCIYVLDERIGGTGTPEEHAASVLQMLDDNGVDGKLCTWTGDNMHMGGQRKAKKMSNLILMRAFERVLRLPPKGLGWTIRTAVKYRHSVYFGASMIHAIMQRRQFFIQPKCKTTISSISNWTMKRSQSDRSKDKYGHAIDALRYCVMPVLDYRYRPPAKMRLY